MVGWVTVLLSVLWRVLKLDTCVRGLTNTRLNRPQLETLILQSLPRRPFLSNIMAEPPLTRILIWLMRPYPLSTGYA